MNPDAQLDTLRERLATDLDGAFPDIIVGFQDALFSTVLRLTASRHDAEEITQESFVRAYRALGSYGPDRIRVLELRPWIWTIALNLCRNRARGRARRPETLGLDGVSERPAPLSTEDEAMAAVASGEWNRRLAVLPRAISTAVVLRHVADLPYGDIAAILDRPEGTVKSDVHRGLERLRALLLSEMEKTR